MPALAKRGRKETGQVISVAGSEIGRERRRERERRRDTDRGEVTRESRRSSTIQRTNELREKSSKIYLAHPE